MNKEETKEKIEYHRKKKEEGMIKQWERERRKKEMISE